MAPRHYHVRVGETQVHPHPKMSRGIRSFRFDYTETYNTFQEAVDQIVAETTPENLAHQKAGNYVMIEVCEREDAN